MTKRRRPETDRTAALAVARGRAGSRAKGSAADGGTSQPPEAGRGTAAEARAGRGEAAGGGLDLRTVRELAALLDEFGLSEVMVEARGERVRLRRGGQAALGATVPVAGGNVVPAMPLGAGGVAAASGQEPVAEASREEGPGLVEITSPFVGTFYRAPRPDAPPYVEIGSRIRPGQVLCIVEAMKLMNEIEAEVAGTIVEIRAQNAQPVEYGEVLFVVRPD